MSYAAQRSLSDAAPSPTTCVAPLIYVPFYDSCVNPCPPGQSYNSDGICAPETSLLTIAAFAVGGLVLYKLTTKRSRR